MHNLTIKLQVSSLGEVEGGASALGRITKSFQPTADVLDYSEEILAFYDLRYGEWVAGYSAWTTGTDRDKGYSYLSYIMVGSLNKRGAQKIRSTVLGKIKETKVESNNDIEVKGE
jgi:hypothetical protein